MDHGDDVECEYGWCFYALNDIEIGSSRNTTKGTERCEGNRSGLGCFRLRSFSAIIDGEHLFTYFLIHSLTNISA